ncbi:hypothetical protein BOC49_33065 [Burkholderia pseudomallei]|nr:hypothetical protein BOC37_14215 [Burkholderia pseudomallei]ARL40760.1 hypothetical protein BOC49_33065 [Burkholderia pseudomallei]ARL75426.1 hypothetical protein BOC54_23990 [Burkholderia pseudomallei]
MNHGGPEGVRADASRRMAAAGVIAAMGGDAFDSARPASLPAATPAPRRRAAARSGPLTSCTPNARDGLAA